MYIFGQPSLSAGSNDILCILYVHIKNLIDRVIAIFHHRCFFFFRYKNYSILSKLRSSKRNFLNSGSSQHPDSQACHVSSMQQSIQQKRYFFFYNLSNPYHQHVCIIYLYFICLFIFCSRFSNMGSIYDLTKMYFYSHWDNPNSDIARVWLGCSLFKDFSLLVQWIGRDDLINILL